MNVQTKATANAKRLGELLVESGMIEPDKVATGLDYGKKTGLPIGRVLVMLRLVDDDQVRAALHVQTLMKFENMPGSVAVKALIMAAKEGIPIEDACVKIGWTSDKFKAGLPPRLRELKDALAETERRLGSDHPELASIMIQLAEFYEEAGMWIHAESLLETAVTIVERKYGPVDLRVAQALSKLATLLFLQDRFSESQDLVARIVSIRQTVLGNDDPDVGFALLDLAETYDVQRKWADAENYYVQALRILEVLYDCDEPVILDLLNRISYVAKRRNAPAEPKLVGTLLTEAGLIPSDKLPEALAYSKEHGMPLARALVVLNHLREEQLRPVLHVQLLIRSSLIPSHLAIRALRLGAKLGLTLEEAIKLTGWKLAGGKSLELSDLIATNDELIEAEKSLPADDPQIAGLCVKLAEIFESYERFGEAEPLYKRALSIVEKTPDELFALVALMDRMAYVALRQKKFEQADALYRRALEIRLTEMGEEHVEVSNSYVNLSVLNAHKGQHDHAITYLQKALPILEKQYGSEHVEVANVVEQMALAYFEIADHKRAEPLFWRAYEIKRKFLSNHSEEIVALLTKLADMYNKDGRFTMADSVLVLFQENRSVQL